MKKSNFLIIIVVILSIIVILFGGKLYLDSVSKTGNDTEENLDLENSNNQDNQDENVNSYEKFVSDYKKNRTETVIIGDSSNLVPDDYSNIENIIIAQDGKATIYFNSSSNYKKEYPNGYVLAGNYLFGKSLYYGNGGFYGYYLVKEDGTITFINEFNGTNNDELKIEENYNNYTQIVDIESAPETCFGDNYYTCGDLDKDRQIFTDINGKKY